MFFNAEVLGDHLFYLFYLTNILGKCSSVDLVAVSQKTNHFSCEPVMSGPSSAGDPNPPQLSW